MPKKSQDGLLEAMEQQEVSIAKAGVLASLPSRCSVIAAANPKNGSYNMNKTVAENLNMSKPILSRFDLVYILRDRADHDLDRRVSKSIMNLHRDSEWNSGDGASVALPRGAMAPPMTYTQQNSDPTHPTHGGQDRIPVWERLAWVADFQKTSLPADLVRDYIAYAREYCKPKMTAEAATVLKDYFMQLRYPAGGVRRADTVPITTRQLEAMIRLSQARAKAALRTHVLAVDALDVVELMRKSVVSSCSGAIEVFYQSHSFFLPGTGPSPF
jgi:DNA helicase MCM8